MAFKHRHCTFSIDHRHQCQSLACSALAYYDYTDLHITSLQYTGNWVNGFPHGACSFETHSGSVFRGFTGSIIEGWPHDAFGVLLLPKPSLDTSGHPRIKTEIGRFSFGQLNGTGRRLWHSKASALRVKYGSFSQGEWQPSTFQSLHYAVGRTSGGDSLSSADVVMANLK